MATTSSDGAAQVGKPKPGTIVLTAEASMSEAAILDLLNTHATKMVGADRASARGLDPLRHQGAQVSRFGPVDPFYRAILEAESNARIERLISADAERYRRQMAACPLPQPIVDHDPGDEDRSSL